MKNISIQGHDNTTSVIPNQGQALSPRSKGTVSSTPNLHHRTAGTVEGLVKAYCRLESSSKMRARIETMLLMNKANRYKISILSKDAMMSILAQMVPKQFVLHYTNAPKSYALRYLKQKNPDMSFEDLLKNCGVDKNVEFQAIEKMYSNALSEMYSNNMDDEDRLYYQDFFKNQYGETQEEQLKNLFDIFGKLPSEIDANSRFINFEYLHQAMVFDQKNGKRMVLMIKDYFYAITNNEFTFPSSDYIDPKQKKLMKANGLLKERPIQLMRLPANISFCDQLTSIRIEGAKLQCLPISLGKLTHLTSLKVKNNQIQHLPESMKELKKLRILDVSDNQIGSFPSFIGDLKELRQIDFANNQLISIPDIFKNLVHLLSLSLENNQLHKLPTSIDTLKKLYELTLNNNPLTKSLEKNEAFDALNIVDFNVKQKAVEQPKITAKNETELEAEYKKYMEELKKVDNTEYLEKTQAYIKAILELQKETSNKESS